MNRNYYSKNGWIGTEAKQTTYAGSNTAIEFSVVFT